MKHTTLTSLTAAVSLAACHDVTAPKRVAEPRATHEVVGRAVVDSNTVWVSMALDDAATRLLSGLAEGQARTELKRALHALASLLTSHSNTPVGRAREEAGEALARLREQSDASSLADLDAIAFAIEGAAALLDARFRD